MNVQHRILSCHENRGTLESARNRVRHLLHQRSPAFSLWSGGYPLSVRWTEQLLRSDNAIASSWLRCVGLWKWERLNIGPQTCVIQCLSIVDAPFLCVAKKVQRLAPKKKCVHCDGDLIKSWRFSTSSKIVVFSVFDASVRVSKKISFHDGDSMIVFSLKGCILWWFSLHCSCVCWWICVVSWWYVNWKGLATYEKSLMNLLMWNYHLKW